MEFHQLQYFVTVAEEASFSRAADRIGVSQPSLSQQIRKLEEELRTPLLDRLPRRVVPTAAGEKLLVHARKVLAELSDARRNLTDGLGKVAGALMIGAIPTIAPYLLPAILRRFSSKYPAVHVEVVEDVTTRLAAMLEAGEIDLAVLSTYVGGPTLHVETIATESLHLLMPAKHALAKNRAISWPALAHEPFLVLQEMHCLSGQVSHFCHRRHVRPSVVMRGSQLSTIAELVSAGLGVSVVPAMMSRQNRDPSRVARPFAGEQPTREICVAWSLLRYRTQAAKAFEQALRAHFSKRAAP